MSIHNSVISWRNYFKFLTGVGEKGTFGYLGITSSIYLNWNISVIHYRIDIKLILVKAEWQWLFFVKRTFLRHFRSRIHNVIKLSIADISLMFRQIETQFCQRDLGSTCDFEVIQNIMWPWRPPWPLGSRARSMHILSLLFDLSIHTSVNSWLSHFKFSTVVVEKRNFRLKRYYVINIFKLEYLRYLLSVWDQTYFGKSRMTMTFIS